jgi:hypothetical protein
MIAMLLFFYGVSGKNQSVQDSLSDFKIWIKKHTQKNGYFSRKYRQTFIDRRNLCPMVNSIHQPQAAKGKRQ